MKLSKFLSFVLRHKPEKVGLTLDKEGWAEVDELIRCAVDEGYLLTRSLLEMVVEENDKNRFAFSDDRQRIRANQGHSIEIDLALPPSEPPEVLYHGTASRFIESIHVNGLLPGNRQHVHLSLNRETAMVVGQRYGKPVILLVHSQEMFMDGHHFFVSANGVWLTERVPIQFIHFTPP